MSTHLQNKLLQYQVNPPEKIWNSIDSSLNEEFTGADKLYNFEQQPSSFVWDRLSNQLDDDSLSRGKTILFFKRYHTPLRYIGAAAIIAIVAITITLFVNKDAVSDELVYHPVAKENITQPLKINEGLQEKVEESKDQVIVNDTKPQSSQLNLSTKSSRYLTVANQKGKTVRLSQKALKVFNCADNIASIKTSRRCKENIQSLQQKMATSLVSPSGDFAGLIDMIKRLDENR
ncbi:MAG TPA: hypothetical protein VNA26_06825 [Chitinophagaceae bacterium]|nr:hypothetical protein [Chitinophagaceae bacterium]